MTDKMRMQTLHEQGLWAKSLIAACPDKQWKLSRPTVKKYAPALMKGDRFWNIVKAAEARNLSALQQMNNHVRGATLEKYHNLRPKPKTIRELKVALKFRVDMERFTSGTHQQRHQNFTKKIGICVGTGGRHIKLKLWNNNPVRFITIIWEVT